MNKIITLTCLFLLLLLLACKSKYHKAADEIIDKVPAPANANLNVGIQDYSVYVPSGWTTNHQIYLGINYYFLEAPKTTEDPNTNVNVITEDMQNLSLDVYKAKTIESVERAIPSAVISGEGDIQANGLKGGWYSYTMKPAGVEASLVSYIFPRDGVAYIITAGTQIKDTPRYRNIFDSIARSLRFYK